MNSLTQKWKPVLWTTGTRLVWLALLLGLGGCNIVGMEPPPSIDVGTSRQSVRPVDTPEFADVALARHVRMSIPAGALDDAAKGKFGIGVSTRSSPFPAVEFRLGPPIDETLIVDAPGNYFEEFPWPLPDNCSDGCEVVVPVTIEQTGAGDTPSFSWSGSYYVEYDSAMPEVAERMTAGIGSGDPHANSDS